MGAWDSGYGMAAAAGMISAVFLIYCVPRTIAHHALERGGQVLEVMPDSCEDFVEQRRDTSNRVQRYVWSRYQYRYQLGAANFKGEGVVQGSCPQRLGKIKIVYRAEDHGDSMLYTTLQEELRSLYYGLAVGALFLLAALFALGVEVRTRRA